MKKALLLLKIVVISPLFSLSLAGSGETTFSRITPVTCSYEVATWNTKLKNSTHIEKVSHPYDYLTEEEVDMVTGCTVCSEDQTLIEIPPLEPFHICYKFADKVRDVLEELVRSNAVILSVRGYKVIRSRGPLDVQGNRTQFSNHSYGTAIDVNRELNGLYDNCIAFGPECRLLHGGKWNPDVPGTLIEGERIVETLKSIGFKWGGEIRGKQKDFMHFSFSGY